MFHSSSSGRNVSASILIGLSTNSRQTDGRGRTDRRLSRECIPFLPGPSIPCFAVCTRAREGEAEKDTDREVCKWQGKETPFDARSLARSLSREGRKKGRKEGRKAVRSCIQNPSLPPSFSLASHTPTPAFCCCCDVLRRRRDKCDRFTRHERQRERERERKGEKLPRRAAHHVLMASLAHERVRRRGATREGGVLILLVSRMRRRRINVHERQKISETSSSS